MPNETAADLRAAGLRVTEPRVAVLEADRRRPHAPASDVVDDRVRLGRLLPGQ
ncbi:hypothetical protein IEE94_01240 [Yimella sp. cx-573]|nr:hypothetical protein [Yimella sp. cx-573]